MTNSPDDPSAKERQIMADSQPGIATQLRQLYQSVQDEAIPDRFLSLLEKLDQAEQQADQALRIKDSAQ
ncbi:MAG: hypothetical protein FP819_25320 [Rhizobiaceae bacterium]|nr:hypothetical protein [Rhizobiaceae bacterium]